jgi:hypothetical protein
MSDELVLLQEEVKAHIEEFRIHVQEERERWDHLITVQENTTRSVNELAIIVTAQVESTKDMIDAWNAANGAIKVGKTLSRFIKWASSLAVVGVGFVWLFDKLSQ